MFFTYRYLAMEPWRKEVQDFLGFELKIPAYSTIAVEKEYEAPLWHYSYRFCDSDGRLVCLLKHDEQYFAYGEGDAKTPGLPCTFGSDEDWCVLFGGESAPPFKGFPWNFSLTFCDKQEQPVTVVTASRLDAEGAVAMDWSLEQRSFDASGKPQWVAEQKHFRWEK